MRFKRVFNDRGPRVCAQQTLCRGLIQRARSFLTEVRSSPRLYGPKPWKILRFSGLSAKACARSLFAAPTGRGPCSASALRGRRAPLLGALLCAALRREARGLTSDGEGWEFRHGQDIIQILCGIYGELEAGVQPEATRRTDRASPGLLGGFPTAKKAGGAESRAVSLSRLSATALWHRFASEAGATPFFALGL